MDLTSIKDIFVLSFETSMNKVIHFLPEILYAIGILLMGWAVSYLVYLFIVKSSDKLRLGYVSEKLGLDHFLKNLSVDMSISTFVASFIQGYIFTMFIINAAERLKLHQIAIFLDQVIAYIPNILIATVIVAFGVRISDTVSLFVRGALSFTDRSTADIIANFSRFSLIFFTILAALVQLHIADDLVKILFVGFIAMAALAGGLAFGLGGKNIAESILQDMMERQKKKAKKDFATPKN